MEKILVLNAGSTSLKFQLFNIDETHHEVLTKGGVERIGLGGSSLTVKGESGMPFTTEMPIANHKEAIKAILHYLTQKYLKNTDELAAIGHRMGYGGEDFDRSVAIDDYVMQKLYESLPLIPLHGPAFVHSIEAMNEFVPNVIQVAVFDTSFHQSVEKAEFLYALPYEMYEKEHVRRYGFHSTSHRYAAKKAKEILGYNGKFICCHLGGGASVTAIDNGKSVATSMGYTPTSGVIMSTRGGDMDPYIPLHIMKTQHKTADEVNTMLNKECGLYGLTGGRADMRDVLEDAEKGDEKCAFAVKAFVYSLIKTIGSYVTLMGGLDTLIFTAGIGENSSYIRQLICEKLQYLGLELDETANTATPTPTFINKPTSKVKVIIIPANEELMIAEDSYQVLKEVQNSEKKAV